jgi:4-hydroxy-2-oxoheptanedioate aldolase
MQLIIENKLKDQLKKLKEEFGIAGIKAEFEAEGSSYDDILRLRNLTNQNNLSLHVKIGGVEAIRDIIDCLEIGVDGIIAPMVESAFGAKKFVSSLEKLEVKDIFHSSINIETKNGVLELDDILNMIAGNISNITIGRSDLSGSYMDKAITANSSFIAEKVIHIAQSAKKIGYSVTMGGTVNIKTLEVFEKHQDLKMLLDKVETRKVIIPVQNFIDDPIVLDEALKFEELYVMTKKAYLDRRIKSELDRLTSLKTRLI